MRVLSAGGGSGGHVTPALAVINELSRIDPELVAAFVCDKSFERQAKGKMQKAAVPVEVHVIAAGKLRRYHGESWLKRALDVRTNVSNLFDVFKIITGFFQSIVLIKRFNPDVVFAKGGFVCLPLGYAAKVLGVPVVLHDSDTRPGLTNRLLSRFAARIATGSPLENYPYNPAISAYTGVPIDEGFRPFSDSEQRQAKEAIGVDTAKPLIVVTGGGLGAHSINYGVAKVAPTLLEAGYSIYQVTGVKHYGGMKTAASEHEDYHIVDFVYDNMVQVLGAADLVISRASATFLQELAALAKPVIAVPAGHLSDQVKNAAMYKEAGAVLTLDDKAVLAGDALVETINTWRSHPDESDQMVKHFHAFARPDAAKVVATMVHEATKHSGGADEAR